MTPDIKIKDYYLSFIANAKKDIELYTAELNYYTKVKDKCVEEINSEKDKYVDKFKIDINNWDKAVKRANFLIRTERDITNRFLLNKIAKLDTANKKIAEYSTMIYLANKRKTLKFRQYETLVSNYYNKVHKYVLQGYGYRYGFGIGVLAICRWRIADSAKPKVDYVATAENKKKLLAEGKKLWNKYEAQWYAERRIPYDGIDYRIFSKQNHIYEINIYKSKLFTYRNHKFEHTEYVNKKFKGCNAQQLADICNNLDEIANMPVDLKYKLNMNLIKDPSNYILYIRNNEQDRYHYGAHNS